MNENGFFVVTLYSARLCLSRILSPEEKYIISRVIGEVELGLFIFCLICSARISCLAFLDTGNEHELCSNINSQR